MKDFLQGRPQSRSIRPAQASEPHPSHFPPISQPAAPVDETISGEPTPPTVEKISTVPPQPQPQATHEPTVEAIPDAQGRIAHIVVTCSCGEQTIVQCNY